MASTADARQWRQVTKDEMSNGSVNSAGGELESYSWENMTCSPEVSSRPAERGGELALPVPGRHRRQTHRTSMLRSVVGPRNPWELPSEESPASTSPEPARGPTKESRLKTTSSYRDSLRAVGQEAIQKTWKKGFGAVQPSSAHTGDNTPTTIASTPTNAASLPGTPPAMRGDSPPWTPPQRFCNEEPRLAIGAISPPWTPPHSFCNEESRFMMGPGTPPLGLCHATTMPDSPSHELMSIAMPQAVSLALDCSEIAERLMAVAPCHYED